MWTQRTFMLGLVVLGLVFSGACSGQDSWHHAAEQDVFDQIEIHDVSDVTEPVARADATYATLVLEPSFDPARSVELPDGWSLDPGFNVVPARLASTLQPEWRAASTAQGVEEQCREQTAYCLSLSPFSSSSAAPAPRWTVPSLRSGQNPTRSWTLH